MNLSTNYMGLSLRNPFVAGPSPLTEHIETIMPLVDSGIAAVVLPPLFEEQLQDEEMNLFRSIDMPAESFAEPDRPVVTAKAQIAHLADVKKRVDVPVIASISAVNPDRWTEYAALMEKAGADALELDFYFVAIDATEPEEAIERRFIDVLRRVKGRVKIPVSVKLTAFHTSLVRFSRSLEAAGADGLVLLHRFYEHDIDIENLEPLFRLRPSDSRELLLRLRWLAIISGAVDCSLAASGGVHSVPDTVKAIMSGADCVQITSLLLQKGSGHIATLLEGLEEWMEKNGYDSVRQMRGSMNIKRLPDPGGLSRRHYMAVLSSWPERDEA
ncbi:MAG TPA: dihydroorotate dehydrogenase-like protein [Nitrospirota bacterium]|nr:dihydroorotate dehydrogenase-like protein [Nitrospirota bacterium]